MTCTKSGEAVQQNDLRCQPQLSLEVCWPRENHWTFLSPSGNKGFFPLGRMSQWNALSTVNGRHMSSLLFLLSVDDDNTRLLQPASLPRKYGQFHLQFLASMVSHSVPTNFSCPNSTLPSRLTTRASSFTQSLRVGSKSEPPCFSQNEWRLLI